KLQNAHTEIDQRRIARTTSNIPGGMAATRPTGQCGTSSVPALLMAIPDPARQSTFPAHGATSKVRSIQRGIGSVSGMGARAEYRFTQPAREINSETDAVGNEKAGGSV